MKEKIIENKGLIISFIVIYMGMFLICSFNMFAQDEYNYSNIAWTSERIESFKDIASSQASIYKNWSGRIPALTMVQVFLYLGKGLYDFINPLVFLLFIVMILKIANKKVTVNGSFVVLLFALFGTYKFWEKYIWISGSLNYLWPVTLMLIVMYYLYNIVEHNKKINVLSTIFLFIVSFFAGWSHENTVFILGSFIIFLAIFNFKKIWELDNKTKLKFIISVILFGIGAIILIFCPGNFGRLSGTTRKLSILPVLKNIAALYKIIILYILTIVFLKKSKIINSTLDVNLLIKKQFRNFIFPTLFAILPMIIISEFPIRAGLAYEVMMYIIILQNLQIIYNAYKDSSKKNIKIIERVVIAASIVLLYSKVLFTGIYMKPYNDKMQKQIENSLASGKKDIIVSKFEHLKLAKFMGVYMDVFPKSTQNSIINYYMSIYYGANTITAVKDGFVNIEIYLNNEDNITNYNLVNKNTNEIIAQRMVNFELPMPGKTIVGTIIFEVPIEELNDAHIELPDEVRNSIYDIQLKTNCDLKNFDAYSIIN